MTKPPDRGMQEQPDGQWAVWCRKHGKRYTYTLVPTQADAVVWWREHTGSVKDRPTCRQPAVGPPVNPFEGM